MLFNFSFTTLNFSVIDSSNIWSLYKKYISRVYKILVPGLRPTEGHMGVFVESIDFKNTLIFMHHKELKPISSRIFRRFLVPCSVKV